MSEGLDTTTMRVIPTRAMAAAKINLALHVTGQRPDGYHTLSSLVAFAETGDVLTIAPADADRLTISGPFAGALGTDPSGNIVLRALAAGRTVAAGRGLRVGSLSIHLDKRLPVASGIGGGSADAAALLSVFARLHPELAAALRTASLALGADVPMCLDDAPARVEGIGEVGTAVARFPALPCLLVNPIRAVETPEVFRRLQRRDNPAMPDLPDRGFHDIPALLDYLRATRNDLSGPAEEIAPDIAEIRAALLSAGADFARMSGSGATVFGLFTDMADMHRAARRLSDLRPDWWVAPTRLKAAGLATADMEGPLP